jgi:hypothetical protein
MRQGVTTTALLIVANILAGCASGGGGGGMGFQQTLVWVRTDGQSGKSNPALADQFANDRAACVGSASSDNAALERAKGCMGQRGYVLVPADQAEATAARFRAQTASKYPPATGAH